MDIGKWHNQEQTFAKQRFASLAAGRHEDDLGQGRLGMLMVKPMGPTETWMDFENRKT